MEPIAVFDRNLRLAGAALLLWSLAHNLMAPLLPLYAMELGAGPKEVGLIGGIENLGPLVLVMPLSLLADRAGHRRALMAAWGLSTAGTLALALADDWQQMLPGAFAVGAVMGALPALNTLVLQETQLGQRTRTFALLYAAAPLGAMVSSAVAGLLAQAHGLRTTTLVAGIVTFLGMVALAPLTPSGEGFPASAQPSPGPGTGERLSVMAVFALVAGTGFLLIALPGNFMIPYLREVGHQSYQALGLYASLLSAAQLAWSLVFSVWPGVRGHLPVTVAGTQFLLSSSTLRAIALSLAANGAFGVLFPQTAARIWPLAIILRGSLFTLQSLGSALLGDVVSPGRHRTTRMTLLSMATGLGGAGAPVAGGWLYARSPALPFWACGLAGTAGSLLLLALLRFLRLREVKACLT